MLFGYLDKIAELEKDGDDCPLTQTTSPTVSTPATPKPTPACKPVKTIATGVLTLTVSEYNQCKMSTQVHKKTCKIVVYVYMRMCM